MFELLETVKCFQRDVFTFTTALSFSIFIRTSKVRVYIRIHLCGKILRKGCKPFCVKLIKLKSTFVQAHEWLVF